ncbi:MAG: TetR/AcrR family transcriptional regulator, partial [Sphingomonadales bacterium]
MAADGAAKQGVGAGKVTRAEQRDRSMAAILDTAVRLFAERGFSGVSLDEIAAETGLRRSLILYYYRSKDELWRAAATRVSSAFNATFGEKMAAVRGAAGEARLHATLTASLDAFLEQPDLPRFMVREGGTQSARLQWLVEHFDYATVEYGSPALRDYVGTTIMRDTMFAILLSMAALGPLMEASLSQAAGRRRSGIHPMT